MTTTRIRQSDIASLSAQLAAKIKGGEIFALIGPLGAGKTTLVKAVGKKLGVRRTIPSPTFTLMNTFTIPRHGPPKGRRSLTLYHLDLYRLRSFREVASLGITEVWGKKDTVVFIEWANKIKKHLPEYTNYIYIRYDKRIQSKTP